MNKSLLFQNRFSSRISLVIAICILLSQPAIHLVRADAAPPPDPTVGGVGPYQPQKTNVQMLAETVIITVPPYINEAQYVGGVSNQISVSASFTMQNQGHTEEKMQVLFPLTRLNYDWSSMESDYSVDPSSFIAFVNGTPVPTTEITTPAEKGYQLEWDGHNASSSRGFNPDVHWAAFDVTFPAHQKVLLWVDYKMNGYSGFTGISYILETGAGWYGNILSADLILRFPYEATSETILSANPGYSFSSNEMRWKLINFEPTRKSDLDVRIIPPGAWQDVLELRSRVERHPQDADGWYKLGDRYITLGFWDSPGGIMVRNQHMVDLSIQAFEKAIELRPNWENPHYALAFALWYSNPAVSKRWDKPAQVPTLDDPIIQRVINELKVAEIEGTIADGNSYSYFDYGDVITHINHVFPDLKFPTPVSTSPISSPTPMAILGTSQRAIAIAVGYLHTCVLTQDGQVKCQGGYGTGYMDSLSDNDIAVVAGKSFTCVLTVQKTVKCKGFNTFGQLGDGTVIYRQTFVDVIGLGGEVAALTAGNNHTCALFKNGGVKCWGENNFGQLGDGTTAYSPVPVQVYDLTNGVTSLAAGDNYTCAILSVGEVKCWGANESGQLGNGSFVNQLKPVGVVGLPQDITALAAGFAHTCALTSQGNLLCWGNNDRGQLGDEYACNHVRPSLVPGLEHNVKTVVAGDQFTCVLTAEGSVKCWGYNNQGQLGDGTDADRSTPADVIGLSGTVTVLAAGNNHACAEMQSGQIKCWGAYFFGVDETKSLETGYLVPLIRLTPVNAIELSIQSTVTPIIATNTATGVPIDTPTSLPTITPSSPHPPTAYMTVTFGLLIVFGMFAFILRRSKFGRNK